MELVGEVDHALGIFKRNWLGIFPVTFPALGLVLDLLGVAICTVLLPGQNIVTGELAPGRHFVAICTKQPNVLQMVLVGEFYETAAVLLRYRNRNFIPRQRSDTC
jgi:hypothetical protein